MDTIDQHCLEDTAPMPRKPRLPVNGLHIEGLSTGEIVREQIISDFDGEPITHKTVGRVRPAGASESLRTKRSLHKQAQREAALRLKHKVLVDAGIIKSAPKLVEVIPKGKRKIGEINGQAILCDEPTKPLWRRT